MKTTIFGEPYGTKMGIFRNNLQQKIIDILLLLDVSNFHSSRFHSSQPRKTYISLLYAPSIYIYLEIVERKPKCAVSSSSLASSSIGHNIVKKKICINSKQLSLVVSTRCCSTPQPQTR